MNILNQDIAKVNHSGKGRIEHRIRELRNSIIWLYDSNFS